MSKLTQYGHSFQTKAIGILITDRDFLQQIADIISPDYFDNNAGKWIIRKTLSYYTEYKTVPTMEVFKVEIDTFLMPNKMQVQVLANTPRLPLDNLITNIKSKFFKISQPIKH